MNESYRKSAQVSRAENAFELFAQSAFGFVPL
jgi:hypothetical protein